MDRDSASRLSVMAMMFITVVILSWAALDEDKTIKKMKADAVSLGHARWVTGTGGNPEFSWLTNAARAR